MANINETSIKQEYKALVIHSVTKRLYKGTRVYKKDRNITGLIKQKSVLGFNDWIVDWGENRLRYEKGTDLNVW